MTDDELESELSDIGDMIGRLNTATHALRRQQTVLRDMKARRGLMVRPVSDHAVIRYLERVKGVDINAIRDELRAIANEAVPAKDGEHHWHEATQTILIIGDSAQIITVLSQDQVEKWANRKLKNGDRITLGEPDAVE
jgi:hypothetical protein